MFDDRDLFDTTKIPIHTKTTRQPMTCSSEDDALIDDNEPKGVPMRITPEMARRWINDSTLINRARTNARIQQYARLMKLGKWKKNGVPIILDKDYHIIDGQHRLLACILSGVSFITYVVVGIEPEVYDTIDRGKPKSAADDLHVANIKNSAVTAAAIRWINSIRHKTTPSNAPMDPEEIPLFAAQNPSISRSVTSVLGIGKIVKTGLAAALHFIFTKKANELLATEFFRDLKNGSNLISGDPVLALRERLLQEKLGKRNLKDAELYALVVRAWNGRKTGQRVTSARGSIMGRDGVVIFPEIL